MKTILTLFFLSYSVLSFSQGAELLSRVPSSTKEFVESESNLLATLEWLETTPVTEEEKKRKEQYSLLLGWLSKSPTVTVSVYDNATPFLKKNPDLLFLFMGGYAKYVIENQYEKNAVKGSAEGIRSAIKLYKLGGLKKDKFMRKLIEIEKQGELEKWVEKQLAE